MPEVNGSASSEFRRLRQAGFTLPTEPVRKRLAAQNLLDTAKSGSLQNDIMPLYESKGRQSLGKFGSSGFNHLDDSSRKAASSMSRSGGFRKEGAPTGSDAQWAWPKLHDPF